MRSIGWWVLCLLWLVSVAIYASGRWGTLPERSSRSASIGASAHLAQAGSISRQVSADSTWPPWRRTADGWQRADWLEPSPSDGAQTRVRQPSLHPLAIALAEIAAVLAAAWLFKVTGGPVSC